MVSSSSLLTDAIQSPATRSKARKNASSGKARAEPSAICSRLGSQCSGPRATLCKGSKSVMYPISTGDSDQSKLTNHQHFQRDGGALVGHSEAASWGRWGEFFPWRVFDDSCFDCYLRRFVASLQEAQLRHRFSERMPGGPLPHPLVVPQCSPHSPILTTIVVGRGDAAAKNTSNRFKHQDHNGRISHRDSLLPNPEFHTLPLNKETLSWLKPPTR